MIRKMLALSVLLVCGLVAGTEPVLAQNAVNNLNSTYGNYTLTSGSTVAAASGQTVTLNNCLVNVGPIGGGRGFFPPATNVPLQINDGSNSEVVTPSSVQTPIANTEPGGGQNAYLCSFTATFSNAHSFGPTTTITSGDSGRAEAANDNGNGYPLTQGVFPLAGSCTGVATASSTIYLYGLGGGGTAQTCTLTTANGTPPVMFRSGVLKGLQATATAAGVGSGSGVLTVKKNGSATTITCTFGTGTTCSDTTHTATFVAGDVITSSFTTASGETLAGVVATFNAF
jgi:hypothetical protein